MNTYIDLIYDKLGNIAGIGGVWEVPDDFEKDIEFALFSENWQSKQKKISYSKRKLNSKYRAWIKWMNSKYSPIDFQH